MEHSDPKEYVAPDLEVLQIETELAFLGSNMESIDDERPELEW